MQFSEQWLREYTNPAISTDALSHLLTMAGLEVEGLEPAGAVFNKVVVAEILSAEKHPDAVFVNNRIHKRYENKLCYNCM